MLIQNIWLIVWFYGSLLKALIGQKYGYRPFPPTISAREFEAIRDQIVSDERYKRALELLDTWFKKNTNILPHVYILQPISSLLPDYADNVSTQYMFLLFSNIKQTAYST